MGYLEQVNHSQRARDTPLKVWFLAEKDGTVIAAHCDCMAGLCEACSHVGAVLFAVESGVRIRDSTTCTQEKSKWMLPSHVREIPYLPVCDMDFTSAKKKYDLMVENEVTPSGTRSDPGIKTTGIPAPTADEQKFFFESISKTQVKPAVLSLVPPFNEQFACKEIDNLPKSLPDRLYREECVVLEYEELLQCCKPVVLEVTPGECRAIEASTRKQSQSQVWYQQRAGRVTASKLKSVCSTNPATPAKSLVKSICYPEAHKFSTAATRWGCRNEGRAREAYQKSIGQFHESLTISDSGLNVDPRWPYLGASPDGFVNCKCCGQGVCEIKCPYAYKDAVISDAAGKKNFCLKKDELGNIYLDKSHAYYYQVQAQIFICGVEYCDFVVWTMQDLFVQRILPDRELWANSVRAATEFFSTCLLPEMVGKCYTRPGCQVQTHIDSPSSTCDEDDVEGPWCYCQRHVEGSTLIGCDNDTCQIKWYHMSCLRMKELPEGDWFCPTCHRLT